MSLLLYDQVGLRQNAQRYGQHNGILSQQSFIQQKMSNIKPRSVILMLVRIAILVHLKIYYIVLSVFTGKNVLPLLTFWYKHFIDRPIQLPPIQPCGRVLASSVGGPWFKHDQDCVIPKTKTKWYQYSYLVSHSTWKYWLFLKQPS